MKKKNNSLKDCFNLPRIKGKKSCVLHHALKKNGVDFATGVPCGVLWEIIDNLLLDTDINHISVNRESEAVGMAAGAYFSGKTPLVYMQNSGLFSSSNDIASLLVPYKIPVFFIISYRGCEGEDAVQHFTTGKATEKLINSFELFYVVYKNQSLDVLISEMFSVMKDKSLPVFLLLKRGWNL